MCTQIRHTGSGDQSYLTRVPPVTWRRPRQQRRTELLTLASLCFDLQRRRLVGCSVSTSTPSFRGQEVEDFKDRTGSGKSKVPSDCRTNTPLINTWFVRQESRGWGEKGNYNKWKLVTGWWWLWPSHPEKDGSLKVLKSKTPLLSLLRCVYFI